MWVYLVEAVPYNANESVLRKWNKKHRHHPVINATVPKSHFQYSFCPSPASFIKAINDFVQWHHHCILESINEPIVLWLSIHGSIDKVGVKFDDGKRLRMHDILSPLHKKLRHEVVLLQSICWGGYPTITHTMNCNNRGPMLVFGPTIEVDVSALHKAEHETLKFLSSHCEYSVPTIKQHINSINAWGSKHHEQHDGYYRCWYWENRVYVPESYPPAVGNNSHRLSTAR